MDTTQRIRVEDLAKAVLEARNGHPGMCLADMYNPETMPADLKKAHEALDKAVDALYRPRKSFASDEDRLQVLFDLYEGLVKARNGEPAGTDAPKKRRSKRLLEATESAGGGDEGVQAETS